MVVDFFSLNIKNVAWVICLFYGIVLYGFC